MQKRLRGGGRRPHSRIVAAPDADTLTAVLVLRPSGLPRNRHFRLHESEPARAARRRAARLRGLCRHLLGAFGHARLLGVEESAAGGVAVRYRLSRLSLERIAHLNACDLVLLRLLLEKGGARLLPAALRPVGDDRTRAEGWLAAASRLGVDDPAGVSGHL
jgi:hypothetical protein